MLDTYRSPAANNILAALPNAQLALMIPSMQSVILTFGDVLYRSGDPILHVYFPINSLVSLLTQIEGHQALEVGLVGHEGMLGIPLALGVKSSPVRVLVLGTGLAMRMESTVFLSAFKNNEAFKREVYRYTYELMVQMTQTAACNRFHRVEERLARWLLMTRDRVMSNQFHLTQELLGEMLGVRRAGVTKAAGALRQRKLIKYIRGDIHILNGVGLESAACQCYQIVKNMHEIARA